MASGKSAYLEAALVNTMRGVAFPSIPANFFVALSSAAWSVTATGSAMSELTVGTGGYGRVSITPNTTNWAAASGSNPASTNNLTVVTFTVTGNYSATIASAYLVDASSAGNIWWGGDLSANKTILNGDSFTCPIGSLIWTEI